VIEGEDVTVSPRTALTLALVFHELTTNAAKYGALSAAGGRVEARWRIVRGQSHGPFMWIEWREQGGPPVTVPTRQGFGSRFIEGSVAAELQGTARLHFDAEGLRCTMEIPLDTVVPDAELEGGWS